MNQKSCHTIVHCDWAKHCAIFQVPNATQHVYPTETGEFCHIYVPKEQFGHCGEDAVNDD